MGTQWTADTLVNVPSANIDRYKRNFLRQAVCELRFPTLLSLASDKPPRALADALRKEFPHWEQGAEMTLGMGAASEVMKHHLFKSAKMTWSVGLKINALSIETTKYAGYADFRDRVLRVVAAATAVIDTDMFTRVGLRYINVVDTKDGPLHKWINPHLVGALASGGFQGVSEHAGRLALAAEDGGCLLQHGLSQTATGARAKVPPDYVIDVDAYRSVVATSDLGAALDAAHRDAFAVFDWALTDKAREMLTAAPT